MAELHVEVVLGAGSRTFTGGALLDHGWSDEGITVDAEPTGAHQLLVSVGCCVVNDVYREAQPGVQVDGVTVRVSGELDAESWARAEITYEVDIDSPEDEDVIARLLAQVEAVAEIPRVLQGEVTVGRR
ncbi:OsmC family protein [Nocardioides conyzicola]|uniref:OsmC family peroxiredoxin n=1 Tax=Nocardioides conyzicola TaxID=1651781 RepID=A0ABP8XMM5_9ACTN